MLWSWLRRLFVGTNYKIVYGSGSIVSQAASEAEVQINNLVPQGWEAVSVGAGGRAADGEGLVQLVDVVVLLRH